jgi:hypothetical protein
MTHRHALALLAGLLPALASAQPAAAPAEEPAVKTDTGTTVVGERESPIGLYITPWRNDAPEAELDRPARFLEEELLPLDPDVFRRQVEYFNTITDHLRARGAQRTGAGQ